MPGRIDSMAQQPNKLNKPEYKKPVWILTIFILIIFSLYILHQPILLGIAKFLIVQDKLQKVDLIKPMEGGPSAERLDYAIELYRQGYASKILLSGGEVDLIGYNGPQPWPKLAKDYAIAKGVPKEAIIIGGATNSTYDEAIDLKKVMQNYGFHSTIIVSDPPHMRRVAMTFNRFVKDGNKNIKLIYHPIPLEKSHFVLNGWWDDEDSVLMVVNEYQKIVFYFFKYFI